MCEKERRVSSVWMLRACGNTRKRERVCVCVCVCRREPGRAGERESERARERERAREKEERGRERERERERARERERERERVHPPILKSLSPPSSRFFLLFVLSSRLLLQTRSANSLSNAQLLCHVAACCSVLQCVTAC